MKYTNCFQHGVQSGDGYFTCDQLRPKEMNHTECFKCKEQTIELCEHHIRALIHDELKKAGLVDEPEEKIEITKGQLEMAWNKILPRKDVDGTVSIQIASESTNFEYFVKELGFK